MFKHVIDVCPDDLDELTVRLDRLHLNGAEVVNVIWQPRRAAVEDQTAAYDTSGSFLIISKVMATSGKGVAREDEVAKPAFA